MGSSQYKIYRTRICTVAMYGTEGPFVFDGHLTMKAYFDDSTGAIDQEKTSVYLAENLFYETNKVLRMQRGEDYDDPIALNVMSYIYLNEPYRIVYNLRASTGRSADNLIEMIQNKDPYARGTCIIMKQKKNGSLTWLTLEEAKEIESSLRAIL